MEKISFKLNSDFYNKGCVEEALNDFRDICDGRILNDDMEIELGLKEEIDGLIKEEFCNYVLGLMKNKTLV